ncbi:spore gernimation protein GerB [Peribacillus cavernae]|uniref:Spore gernimation protein GerB n=1 Tax=Peribacillus cavernae TaxID=1674310 RepID=A0A3S0VJ71_9BACI|nr:GerAB/ArcD/ProY family transporter [Peribacillus cavernae]MDQ0219697.1 spore germination protein (amino acid permease) [Peribacillus cavernae]RUQ25975.1 spore gernimation protein GerB [Peribacillus cavernae]
MDNLPKKNRKVSSFFAMFLVHKMQIGVGLLGFERVIAKNAGYDAWVSILITGFCVNIVIWMSFRMLHKDGNDLISIHKHLFGKWVGGGLSLYFIVYFVFLTITILRTYTEVIQIWLFPGINVPVLLIIFGLLVYSCVAGGFRIVAGIAFIGLLIGMPLLLLKYFPLQYANFSNLSPVLDHSVKDLLLSAKAVTLNFLGFELLLMYYPFLDEPRKAEKWAQIGTIFTTAVYLFSAFVSFAYYTQEELAHSIWATLTMWKIVDLPFVERFEYVGVSIWLFEIIPNVCLGVWAASRGVKRLFAVNQRKSLLFLLFIIILSCMLFQTRQGIDQLNTIVSQVGFWTVFIYIPALFVYYMIVDKVRKRSK